MPKNKEYNSYICKDCEIDFLVKKGKFCPKCGESLFVEHKTSIWIKRPFTQYRRWTKEEDDFVVTGIDQGYSRQEVADELGRTKTAVTKRYLLLKER